MVKTRTKTSNPVKTLQSKLHLTIATGSRAEFGLLRSTIDAAIDDARIGLQLVVMGSHFIAGTHREIKKLGYEVADEIRMQKRGQVGRVADAEALGRGVQGFARHIESVKPDIVLVLGDRIEAFAAAAASAVAGVRLAHVHGGDRAEGVADESMRHAISKLSHIHLAATEESRQRLIKMGEPDDLVFNIGSPAVDGLHDIQPASDAPELILLLHPTGDEDGVEQQRMKMLLDATADLSRLILEPNHDPGRQGIMHAMHEAGIEAIGHLPRACFLSRLKGARAIVGNSSAGLIEAAVLGTPCVNLGSRQAGREKPGNVIDADFNRRSIRAAIKKALKMSRHAINHPYGPGGTGKAIIELLANLELSEVPIHKRNAY